jgi:hypothetical protein
MLEQVEWGTRRDRSTYRPSNKVGLKMRIKVALMMIRYGVDWRFIGFTICMLCSFAVGFIVGILSNFLKP